MRPLSSEQESVLELFNISTEQTETFEYRNISGSAGIYVRLIRANEPCPRCGCQEPKIKSYLTKQINHASLTDRKCTLYYEARRYQCPFCLKTYYEKNPFVFKKMKISAMTVKNVLTDLKNPADTFASIAERYGISPTSAASIFDSHVDMPRLQLTSNISIDECYAFSGEQGKYVLMILDNTTKRPVDILPSRRKEQLLEYFNRIPYEERKTVKYCCTDMYVPYREVIREVFPAASHSIDRFHQSKEIHRQLDRVRVRVMKRYAERDRKAKADGKMVKNESSDEYYLLKHMHWLLSRRKDSKDSNGIPYFDTNRKPRFNKHFQKEMNYSELLDLLLVIDNDLTEAHDLKTSFDDFLKNTTYNDAEKNLRALIRKFNKSSVPEMRECGSTLSNWFREIVNSFLIVENVYEVDPDTGAVTVLPKHCTNASIEGRNRILKLIKNAACGYKNWARFRNRCLYVLRDDAVFRLAPIDEPKARANYKKEQASKERKVND